MRIKTSAALVAVTLALVGSLTGPASAQGPVGANPRSNFSVGALPSACWSSPRGARCIKAGVRYLDKARAKLGQSPYVLPRGFVWLSPAQQVLVLTNLDRKSYGLSPVPGLTAALDRDAAGGVRAANDPVPGKQSWIGFTSNWAGGYPNIVLAYEAWMYDDGPGSGNLDCTVRNRAGCWGHRHDILWRFGSHGALAMGAAAMKGPHGSPGYAMLLVQERPGVHPAYTFRWTQAVRR